MQCNVMEWNVCNGMHVSFVVIVVVVVVGNVI